MSNLVASSEVILMISLLIVDERVHSMCTLVLHDRLLVYIRCVHMVTIQHSIELTMPLLNIVS